jgi:hypothetical protein
VSVVCYQVEVSVTDWSSVKRSPTECGVMEYNLETSTVRRPRPTRVIGPRNKIDTPNFTLILLRF